jgi:hypothetical protein
MLRAQETPTPEPTTVVVTKDLVLGQSTESWLIVLAAIALVLVVALVLTRSLLAAGRLPPPTALVTALSVLTLFAMAGGIAQRGNEAWTIAAAGVGALAGSVTAIYTQRAANYPSEPPAPPEPPVASPGAPPAPTEVTQQWKFEEPTGSPPKPEPHWDD